jgi:sulfide:quinone oxidoreductase
LEGVLLLERYLRRRGLREATRLVCFTPYPRAYPAAPMDEIVSPLLAERGIEVMTFFDVDRVDPVTRTISSIEGDAIRADLPVVIPPFAGVPIAYSPPEVLDESRFVRTDPRTLQVLGVENAFAIGDGAGLPTSKSGVGAHLQAKVVAATLGGRATSFDGRTHCPFDLADGRGTFVTSSYDAPTKKTPPSRLKHVMKMAFARLYWASLRGWLDPVFDVYFRLTAPRPPSTAQAASARLA